MSLRSANEPVLQAIVEILLPSRYHVPELCLVMNSKKQKGSGHFGYLDVFVLGGAEGNNISLELKYISLTGLMRDIKGSSMKKIDANELEKLDKILEKEDEESLLGRKYGQVVGYSAEGVLDERIQIVKSDPNKLKEDLLDEEVQDSKILGIQFAGLNDQIIGIELLEDGLYFGLEGPTFNFPAQLTNIKCLRSALEALYFLKQNIVKRAKLISDSKNVDHPYNKIFHCNSNTLREARHFKIKFT
ncbi:14981_t:CDS:2 [Entrophospora sp. SA101]|nr:14981_t:CDS:2 [Entrophospora sp. SA101]